MRAENPRKPLEPSLGLERKVGTTAPGGRSRGGRLVHRPERRARREISSADFGWVCVFIFGVLTSLAGGAVPLRPLPPAFHVCSYALDLIHDGPRRHWARCGTGARGSYVDEIGELRKGKGQ